MKDVVKVKKEEGKLFTKLEGNDTIKKNYNPFEVDCKIYRRRDGLYMKNRKEKNEKFINLLFKICSDLKIKNSKEEVDNFLNKKC